jgi:hypothetical protein
MKAATKATCSQFSGTTGRTVFTIERAGPDAVILASEFDLRDQLVRQVRFEHLNGNLAHSAYTEFSSTGSVAEQWVLLYDSSGRVTQTFGFDAEGHPIESETYKLVS